MRTARQGCIFRRTMMVTVAVVMVGAITYRALPTRRGGVTTTRPDTRQAVLWSLMVTMFENGGKKTTTFLATAVNASDKEQVLFTPGLVGPILFPASDSGEPLETFEPPRRGEAGQYDFVRLKPGQGFTRTFVFRGALSDLTSVSRVGAKLFIYKPGKEGDSSNVSRVIQASPVDISVRREHPTGE